MMTISKTVKILDMVKEGKSYAAKARHYRVNESAILYIQKDEGNIRKTAAITFNTTAKRVATSHNKTICMEAALAL